MLYYVIVFFVFFLMIRRPPRSTRLTHSFPTRRSSDLLKGKSMAFGDPNPTSGYLVPLVSLRKAGIEPKDYFGSVSFSGGHEQSVLGVLKDRKSTRLNSSH